MFCQIRFNDYGHGSGDDVDKEMEIVLQQDDHDNNDDSNVVTIVTEMTSTKMMMTILSVMILISLMMTRMTKIAMMIINCTRNVDNDDRDGFWLQASRV